MERKFLYGFFVSQFVFDFFFILSTCQKRTNTLLVTISVAVSKRVPTVGSFNGFENDLYFKLAIIHDLYEFSLNFTNVYFSNSTLIDSVF